MSNSCFIKPREPNLKIDNDWCLMRVHDKNLV